MLAAFHVPVGTAGANVPTAQGATHQAAILFGGKVDHVDDSPKSAAKLAVHLLKQADPKGLTPTPTAAGTATADRSGSVELAAAVAGASSLERMMSAGFGAAALGSGVVTPGILSHTASSTSSGGGSSDPVSSSSRKGRGRSSAEATAAAGGGGGGGGGEGRPALTEQPMTAAVAAACDDLDSLVQLLEQYCHPSNGGNWSHDLASFLSQGVHYFMKQMGRQCGTRGWKGEQRIVPEAARRYVRAAMRLAARGQFSKSQSKCRDGEGHQLSISWAGPAVLMTACHLCCC
jgi:hypothetical protein